MLMFYLYFWKKIYMPRSAKKTIKTRHALCVNTDDIEQEIAKASRECTSRGMTHLRRNPYKVIEFVTSESLCMDMPAIESVEPKGKGAPIIIKAMQDGLSGKFNDIQKGCIFKRAMVALFNQARNELDYVGHVNNEEPGYLSPGFLRQHYKLERRGVIYEPPVTHAKKAHRRGYALHA